MTKQETQRATGQIRLHCQRGRRGFWVKLNIFETITDFLWSRDPLDLTPDPEWNSVSYAVGGIVHRHPMIPSWGLNTITVEAGDHMLNVWCGSDVYMAALVLPVRVLPGQTVNVYYTAPRAKGVPATLGFTPS
ncbi:MULTISPECIES: hypothetical protein [Tsukamurella]|uniref:Uncharacterized protein n=2 Tax=Tsukamurella TaxID=2060 RepID=A0A5C5S431_9ACTN|nr:MULTISPECIES: hypothetical protein [Tsukamurella]NMD56922.1 hypothetical protein [Tsukamurella columbiensis]TWS29824.1 hypothetical protein FK530_04620 [Tsukamurella conjunctivitidis]